MGGRHRTDELDGGYNPYQEPSSRRRAGRGKVLVPLAGAVALAVLLGVAAYVIMSRDQGCGDSKAALRVVASPDIAPAITKIAAAYGKSSTEANGACVAVSVKEGDPASVTNSIAGSGATAGKFDADMWIPDSSLWVAKLRSTPKGSGISAPAVPSIARSPVILAAPKPVIEKLSSEFGEPSWSGLMSAANAATPDGLGRRIRVLPLDPTQNAAGLSALLAGAGILKASGAGDEQLVGVLRQLSETAVSSPENMFATMGKQSTRAPIGIASEQSIWAFNKSDDGQLAGLYPAEGTISLDYPVLITAKDQATRDAAKSFATALTGNAARKTIRDNGFRTPDGKPGGAISQANGLNPKAPRSLKVPDAETVNQLAQAWSRLKLGGRILALLDISGTMALPAVGAPGDRMRLISQTAIEGLKLFPDKTEIGTWIFSTNLNGKGVDYKEAVPIGPIGASLNGTTRREVISRSLANIKAKATGDTGLNDTLAAAYDKMKAEYEADKINTILIFTDGVGNDDPEGGITNAEILRKLRDEFDETQPISVIIVALGAKDAAGRRQMQNLAKATQGEAFFPNNALEIRKVFLEGISRRLCAPNCNSSQ
ncbi:substrate-binding and VWA domain-containing protein [Sphaerisporangium rubeum]